MPLLHDGVAAARTLHPLEPALKGLTDGQAAVALAAWARRQAITIAIEVRRVGNVEAVSATPRRPRLQPRSAAV